MPIVALVFAALVSAGCDPGPLPTVTTAAAESQHGGYPSRSEDPFALDGAIRTNNLPELRKLLEQGANPNERWGRRGDRFPLQEVFDTGGFDLSNRAEFVRLLLAHGADPNMRWCPYESRFREGQPRCTSEKGTSALAWAAAAGRTDLVEMLLAAGADPTMRDWSGSSALDYAPDDVTFEMIARVQFPDLSDRDHRSLQWLSGEREPAYGRSGPELTTTPILRALSEFHGAIYPSDLGLLLRRSNTWHTPASVDRRVSTRLRIYLRIGANPNERAKSPAADITALGFALTVKRYSAARLLLDNGADVNQRWCVRPNPYFALAEEPADPRCTPETGSTPLMWAAASGDREAVALLREYAADVSLRNWAGLSAADVARTDSIRRLLQAGSTTATPLRSR